MSLSLNVVATNNPPFAGVPTQAPEPQAPVVLDLPPLVELTPNLRERYTYRPLPDAVMGPLRRIVEAWDEKKMLAGTGEPIPPAKKA